MDHVKLTTSNDGELVRRTRDGLQVKRERHQGGITFINSSMRESGIKPFDATDHQTATPFRYEYDVVFLQHGERAPRSRTARSGKPAATNTMRKQRREVQNCRQQVDDPDTCDADRLSSSGFIRRTRELALWQNEQVNKLPVASNYELPFFVPNDDQKYFLMCLAGAADIGYPFNKFGIVVVNPFKTVQMIQWVTQHPLALEACVAPGAAIEVARQGRKGSRAAAKTQASLCGLIKRTIDSPEHSEYMWNVLVHAIACSALCAIWLDDPAAYKVHMKGLGQLLDAHGGTEDINPNNITKISCCNLEGAIQFGQELQMPFVRTQPSLLGLLPAEVVETITHQLRVPLQSCHVEPVVIDTITSVCSFNRILLSCRAGEIAVQFEPEHLMEEYYDLMHQLLTLPHTLPLRMDSSRPRRPPTKAIHLAAFETALRAATLICLRAPTLELLLARVGNENLLTLLYEQLHLVLIWFRQARRQAPSLESGTTDEFIGKAKPFLVWMCLLGDVIGVYVNFHLAGGEDLNGRGFIVRQLMIEILDGRTELELNDLQDGDLRVSRLWDLGSIIGGKWDERRSLQRILERPERPQHWRSAKLQRNVPEAPPGSSTPVHE
ncbi:hypothetical protein BJ170DRAFT_288060 [Xylariales sp. AK1849]|nr:hypothetical protein BJ170DRAFT_288060 [Xylariales sp. AK1849]